MLAEMRQKAMGGQKAMGAEGEVIDNL